MSESPHNASCLINLLFTCSHAQKTQKTFFGSKKRGAPAIKSKVQDKVRHIKEWGKVCVC